MASIDDIKKRLELDKLDSITRKEMFNKFVEKGGKVIDDEDDKKKRSRFNRERQQYLLKLQEERLKKYSGENTNEYTKYETDKKRDDKKSQKFYANEKIKRSFATYISGMLLGIFSLGGYFTKKFSYEMTEPLKKILQELKQAVEPLLSIKDSKKWEIVEVINLKNPFAYEILVRYDSLIDQNDLIEISSYFNIHNFALCPNIIKQLVTFFKKLVVLYPYWESAKSILWDAQLYYQDVTAITPSVPKSKISKNIDRLFAFYFPRLFMILNYNQGYNYEFSYERAYNIASISNEEDIGSITKELNYKKKLYYEELAKEKERNLAELKKSLEQKELEKIPKYVIKGLELIDKIIEEGVNKEENETILKLIEKNEKMFYFLIIFNEFDREYSFLLTTSQIKYDVKHISGTKIDIKDDLDNLYIKFNEIISLIKEYIKLTESQKEFEETESINKIFKDQELTKIETKRVQIFYEIRTRAIIFFKSFSNIMQTIIADYEGERMILKNGEDKLHFELLQEKKPKFENVKIITAIILSFSLSSAIHYYLTKGKLCSKGLYFED